MAKNMKMLVRNLNFYYGSVQALKNVNLEIPANRVTALIGPSGCGKTTFLRCLNRMNDVVEGVRVEGQILLDGEDIYAPEVDPVQIRRRVGMVFQKSNPFPKTVFENVAYGLRINGSCSKKEIANRVERSLKDAALWDEVADRLHDSAMEVSG